MTLVNSGNSRARSANVVEDCFGDLKANTQPLKAGRQRPSEVVQAPWRHTRATIVGQCLIELLLAFVIPANTKAR